MRLIRISLAAKYRFLFGLAVLLIIGAALYWPWHLVKDLVEEQPYREAQRIADDHFRHAMGQTGAAEGQAGGMHGLNFGILDDEAPVRPRFIRAEIETEQPRAETADEAFLKTALSMFRQPGATGNRPMYRVEDTAEGRVFRYAQAVRVSERCLQCHGEGKTARRYADGALAGVILVTLPFDPSRQYLFWNRAIIIAAGVLAGILAVLVFYFITRRFILSPIHELREVARKVSDGDTTVRSALRTGDEFEQLAESFNTMLERLGRSQNELRTANRSLDTKLNEMAEINVALHESNKVKSEFLANVTHELRTPLTSIIGFAEVLRESAAAPEPEKAARYAENILISGRILLEIINELLDLAKLEAGRVELRIAPVDLGNVCRTLADFVRPLSDKKHIRIDLELSPGLPELSTDRGRLHQILFNLMSNAVKFTPEHGRIRLHAGRLGDQRVRVSVTDSGPGIAPENHKIIFEKFRQIDASATREHHGTGLGLAIAKELTTLMGGEIGVNSRPGQGASFWITLPISVSQPTEYPLISLS